MSKWIGMIVAIVIAIIIAAVIYKGCNERQLILEKSLSTKSQAPTESADLPKGHRWVVDPTWDDGLVEGLGNIAQAIRESSEKPVTIQTAPERPIDINVKEMPEVVVTVKSSKCAKDVKGKALAPGEVEAAHKKKGAPLTSMTNEVTVGGVTVFQKIDEHGNVHQKVNVPGNLRLTEPAISPSSAAIKPPCDGEDCHPVTFKKDFPQPKQQ